MFQDCAALFSGRAAHQNRFIGIAHTLVPKQTLAIAGLSFIEITSQRNCVATLKKQVAR